MSEISVVAWDGEGWGDDPHIYGLLASSTGVKLRAPEHGLRTPQMLDALWTAAMNCEEPEDTLHVLYGGGYDWNHWIGDLDLRSAALLYSKRPIRLGLYEVLFNGMWFEIRRGGHWFTFWDVWRYWQTPFVKAVEDTYPDFHGLDKLREFKALRDQFGELATAGRFDEIEEYNDLECEALAEITRRLFGYLDQAHIRRPSVLTGAGSLAGSLLVQHKVAQFNEQPPAEVMPAVLSAYAGGRPEAWKYGYHPGPEFWTHDQRSAYPAAMRYLPALVGGSWRHYDSPEEVPIDWEDRFSVWHIRWDYRFEPRHAAPHHRGYPFFFRDGGGNMLYPGAGEGWHWWPELIAALENGFDFDLLEGWVFTPATDELPFSWVELRYAQRAQLRAQGLKGAELMLKKGYAAIYGKTCQARGHISSDPPRHHNLAWAGWTTASTRAEVFSLACTAPNDIVYMMTDSVAATRQLPIREGTGLGEWEVNKQKAALVIQAGVAFTWGEDGTEHAKFRGFDPASVRPDAVRRTWKANVRSGDRSPLLVPTRRPVTLGSALASEEWFAKWNSWQDHFRELDLYGGDGKRWAPAWRQQKPWLKLENLEPWGVLELDDGIESALYEPRWEAEDSRSFETEEGRLRDRLDEEYVVGEMA